MVEHQIRSTNGNGMDYTLTLPNVATNIKITFLLIICLLCLNAVTPFTITGRYCTQNISVKYQEPVTLTTQTAQRNVALGNGVESSANNISPVADAVTKNKSYVIYEPRIHWDTKTVCCPGYRTLRLGFCEPICETICARFSYCATPNQCECLAGYEEYHPNNKEIKLLDCRPVCVNGCPLHSECVARNQCKCRSGYRDTSSWLMPIKCERIRCSALDQRYDAHQKMCVKIEMSMEDLMRKVAARLTKGLTDFALEDGEDGDEDEEDEVEEENEQNEVVKESRMETKTKGHTDT